MSEQKPFLPTEAKDFPAEPGDYLLPICLPEIGLLMGEDLAVIVMTTVEGQRVGVPIGMQAVLDLHKVLGEALRMMQATEGGTVQ